MKLYFYKCAGEDYSTGHVYFDHGNGVAGYTTVQQRAKYIGHMTEKELEREIYRQRSKASGTGLFGHREGYTNISRSFNSRY